MGYLQTDVFDGKKLNEGCHWGDTPEGVESRAIFNTALAVNGDFLKRVRFSHTLVHTIFRNDAACLRFLNDNAAMLRDLYSKADAYYRKLDVGCHLLLNVVLEDDPEDPLVYPITDFANPDSYRLS